MSQRTPKPTIRLVRPAKTHISLRIPAVWSESSLIACVFYSLRPKREPLPYCVDGQADLSFCWSHRSYCRFYKSMEFCSCIRYIEGRKQCCKLHYCLWRVSIKPRLPFSIWNVLFDSKGNLLDFYFIVRWLKWNERNVRKRTFWHVRSTKTQINLRIREIWLQFRCPHGETLPPCLPKMCPVKNTIRLNAQADLSFRWAHRSEGRLSDVSALINTPCLSIIHSNNWSVELFTLYDWLRF